MVLKLINKIVNMMRQYQSNAIFKLVNCDINKICIGPELNYGFEIRHPEKLNIDNGTVINGLCMINAFGEVFIGKYCHIGKGLTLYTHNHNFKSEEAIPYDNKEVLRTVTIGDAVWIGANVTIAPGVKVGHGVIISTGSVVFGEVPDCAIVRGNPAEVIGYRNKKVFWNLYSEEKFA